MDFFTQTVESILSGLCLLMCLLLLLIDYRKMILVILKMFLALNFLLDQEPSLFPLFPCNMPEI